MAKVNSTSSLVLYGKVPDLGWRRGAVAYAKNNVPKPGVMVVNGCELTCENYTFQIRMYSNRKNVYTPVGSDYRQAKTLLERLMDTRKREALDERLGISLPKSQTEIEGERIAEEAEREAKRKTLAQFSTEYLAKKVGLSRHSEALYRCIPAFIAHSGKKFPEDLTERDVVNWFNSLKAAGYAQRTCQTRYSTLRGFLSSIGVNLNVLIDKSEHRKMNKKPDANTEPYSDEEIALLLAGCDEYHKVVYTLLLMTGLREQEATHLTWNQIKWTKNKIKIEGEMAIHHPKRKGLVIKFKTKNGKGREVPLFPSLKTVLEEWRLKHPDAVFVIGTKRDLPNTHLLRHLKKDARKAGINCGMCETCVKIGSCANLFLHKFRHSYAHTCLDKFSIHQVSKWMGHSNIAVTAIYLTGTPKDADVDPFALELAA